MKLIFKSAVVAASVFTAGTAFSADPIKVRHIYDASVFFKAYGDQINKGMELGFEYQTGGSNKVAGRDIKFDTADTKLKADQAKSLVQQAFGDDEVDIVTGPLYSAQAISVLPVAEEYEKILMPEGVAESITGANGNKYIIRIGRNSYHDGFANAAAAPKGAAIATIAQDYAFGKEGIMAFEHASKELGVKIVSSEWAEVKAKDFTANIQRIFDSLKNQSGAKRIFVVWAGAGGPSGPIEDADPSRIGAEQLVAGNILAAMKGYKRFAGRKGGIYYYYELPSNDINDWMVTEHFKRHGIEPDFFTAQGFAQAQAIVNAFKATKGNGETGKLLGALKGMRFQSPRGEVMIRPEDGQALQSMYVVQYKDDPSKEWATPVLVKELTLKDMNIPVNRK